MVMKYAELVKVYGELASTTKRLEKRDILARFLPGLLKEDARFVYLFHGKVTPDYDSREFGISRQLIIKALAQSFGKTPAQIATLFAKKGDLGDIAEGLAEKRTQKGLFAHPLTISFMFEQLTSILGLSGKGSVERKLGVIEGLLSHASADEVKYIVRTLLGDLRIGVQGAVLVDAIAQAWYPDESETIALVQEAYDLTTDFAGVLHAAAHGKAALRKMELHPNRPLHVMLPVKVTDLAEGFEICGKPVALEHKYDGFRMLIMRDDKGEISLFTRKLESVKAQFPDVVAVVKKTLGTVTYILDAEVVGHDPKTGKTKPFEAISQRIRRKHAIETLMKELPVVINVFDILYYKGQGTTELPFKERRTLLEKIIPRHTAIHPSEQVITADLDVAHRFYTEALAAGEEGIMIKKLDAVYRPGRRVGYIVKMKPLAADIDVVILGAETGTGKRAGWLTSYVVGCKDGNAYKEIGMVSSGLKEKESEGMTYEALTKLLKPLVTKTEGNRVWVKPQLVLSITYQNIQPSPHYASGYGLRFPRILHYRPDRKPHDIVTLAELEKIVKKQHTSAGRGIQ
jgi:DNA ligase-1